MQHPTLCTCPPADHKSMLAGLVAATAPGSWPRPWKLDNKPTPSPSFPKKAICKYGSRDRIVQPGKGWPLPPWLSTNNNLCPSASQFGVCTTEESSRSIRSKEAAVCPGISTRATRGRSKGWDNHTPESPLQMRHRTLMDASLTTRPSYMVSMAGGTNASTHFRILFLLGCFSQCG